MTNPEEDHVTSELRQLATRILVDSMLERRAGIEAEIIDARRLLRGLFNDLDDIDCCMRHYDPQGSLAPQPRVIPARPSTFMAQNRRFITNSLKKAKEPLTSLEVAKQVISTRGLPDDHASVIVFRKRVSAILRTLMRRGIVRQVSTLGRCKRWELAQ